MDVTTAILACSLYADDVLVHAIVDSGSANNAYYVRDVAAAANVGEQPRSLEGALDRTGYIEATAGAPAVGLMQLHPAWLTKFGRQLRDAFDPCVNVSIGTAMLSQFAYECARTSRTNRAGTPDAVDRQTCVTHKYAEGIGLTGFDDLVAFNVLARSTQTIRPSAVEAPLFTLGTESNWGPLRILVPLGRTR